MSNYNNSCWEINCGTSKDIKTVYSILIEKNKIIDVVEGYVDPGDGDQQLTLMITL